jgi:hypothetical protein
MGHQRKSSGAAKIISSIVPNVTSLASFLRHWLDPKQREAIQARRCREFDAFLKGTLVGSLTPVPSFTPDPNFTCMTEVFGYIVRSS